MKLSVLFLICSLSMTYAAESYAQKTMISLEEGDEKQLSQVFLNLLKNSMQSLEGKTDGQIEVTLEVTDKLYIKLLDNGRGIPMELQEKIFVPFFTTKTEGTGIGLSLCRQIIKRHGGNLYLQESGQGRTLFVIEWPIVPFIPK